MGTTELHICNACGAGHVKITGRVAIGYCRCEQVELACPDCGATRSGVVDEEDVQRYQHRAQRVLA